MARSRAQVVNARVPVRRWWPVVLDAAAVSQQLSLATAAGLAPVHLLLGHATAEHLMILSASLLLFGTCRPNHVQCTMAVVLPRREGV